MKLPYLQTGDFDLIAHREVRRVDVSPLRRPHGINNGKVYFTSELNKIVARYDPAANRSIG